MTRKQIKAVRKWLALLRSGKYKQTTGVLYKPTVGYCCLGVLCRSEGIRFKKLDYSDDSGAAGRMGIKVTNPKDQEADTAPYATGVIPEYQFKDITGFSGLFENDLMEFNDHKGLNFNQIAYMIEAQLKKVMAKDKAKKAKKAKVTK